MCGRYPLSDNEEEVAELLAAEPTEELRTPYNIAPTQPVP
jgi:putative SOS response-associated peptidase YedK